MGLFGLAPSEFWRLEPQEIWWFIEAHKKKHAPQHGDMDELWEIYQEAKAEEAARGA